MIVGTVTRDRNGKISLAGPLTNIILALLFLGAGFFATGILAQLVNYGFMINLWLGAFNLIPILNFDGKKILAWSKPVYIAIVVVSVALIALMYSIA
jgi:Zn-dependent protease